MFAVSHKPPPRKYLTRVELHALLQVASSNLRDHALVLVIYECALRASEPGRLRLEDARHLHRNLLYVYRGKGSLVGFVDLSGTTVQAVSDWITFAYPNARARNPDAWLFPARRYQGRNQGMTRTGVYAVFKTLATAARLPLDLCHPHVLKHTRVMDLYQAAKDAGGHPHDALLSVAKLVGHAAAQTTLDHYLHETKEQKDIMRRATEVAVTVPKKR